MKFRCLFMKNKPVSVSLRNRCSCEHPMKKSSIDTMRDHEEIFKNRLYNALPVFIIVKISICEKILNSLLCDIAFAIVFSSHRSFFYIILESLVRVSPRLDIRNVFGMDLLQSNCLSQLVLVKHRDIFRPETKDIVITDTCSKRIDSQARAKNRFCRLLAVFHICLHDRCTGKTEEK